MGHVLTSSAGVVVERMPEPTLPTSYTSYTHSTPEQVGHVLTSSAGVVMSDASSLAAVPSGGAGPTHVVHNRFADPKRHAAFSGHPRTLQQLAAVAADVAQGACVGSPSQLQPQAVAPAKPDTMNAAGSRCGWHRAGCVCSPPKTIF